MIVHQRWGQPHFRSDRPIPVAGRAPTSVRSFTGSHAVGAEHPEPSFVILIGGIQKHALSAGSASATTTELAHGDASRGTLDTSSAPGSSRRSGRRSRDGSSSATTSRPAPRGHHARRSNTATRRLWGGPGTSPACTSPMKRGGSPADEGCPCGPCTSADGLCGLDGARSQPHEVPGFSPRLQARMLARH